MNWGQSQFLSVDSQSQEEGVMAKSKSKDEKTIPLNIVMSYPVHWSRYNVLRDFMQNFYDSVDTNQWHELYHYDYDADKEMLSMNVDGVEFSYEWLLHIGASTKTVNSDKYAGYFGEGFKIASLCAIRDYNWKVEMYSGAWMLEVITLDQKIDNQPVKVLAYRLSQDQRIEGSRLILYSVSESEYAIFQTVLESFYYPENPMFGEKVWESEKGAIYKRSKTPINPNLPYVSDYGRKGAVFCGYQMLGTCPFDFIVCLHRYKKTDRERKALYSFDVIDVIKKVAYYTSCEGAYFLLTNMRRYWMTYDKRKIDIDSWSSTIDSLIYRVSTSERHVEMFHMYYPNLLCVKQVRTVHEYNQRSQAKSWLENQEKQYTLVKDTFERMNYPTLEEECEKHGGFVIDDNVVSEVEIECFKIIEKIAQKIYNGFIILSEWPERKLITNEKAIFHGMALTFRKRHHLINNRGLAVRYDIGKIYLKKSIFQINGYYDALSTYIHELCHVFGGDSSHSFSSGLTYAMEILLSHPSEIEAGKRQWERIFEGCSA